MKMFKRIKSALLFCGLVLSMGGGSIAHAGLISLTETFDEFGAAGQSQNGFNWQFAGLAPANGMLTITFDWEGMDFDARNEKMEIFADGNSLGFIGDVNSGGSAHATEPDASTFVSDCDGSGIFMAAAALVSNGMLSLTSTPLNVNSSGGLGGQSLGSPFGFISANLSYDMASVPEPATLALMGLGLAGLGYRKRK
jgi:hypothetical protein